MAEAYYPLRKTTQMALKAVFLELNRALTEIANAALADGEAPEGARLDVDRSRWVYQTPDIAPKEETPSEAEPSFIG